MENANTKVWEDNWSGYRDYYHRKDHIDFFNIKKEDNILEIGCGEGFDLRNFRNLGYNHLTGIDISDYLVKKCKRQGFNVKMGDIRNLQFSDNSFDCIFLHGVFHHIKEYEKAFKEINRVLKKEGLLCAIEPKKTVLRIPLDFITNYLPIIKPLKVRKIIIKEEKSMMDYWFKNYDSILKLLEKYFEIIKLKKDCFFIYLKCKKKGLKIKKE